MPEGIESLLVDDLDSRSMNRMVQEFHDATGGYDFKEFKKYLADNNVKILEIEPVEVTFSDTGIIIPNNYVTWIGFAFTGVVIAIVYSCFHLMPGKTMLL